MPDAELQQVTVRPIDRTERGRYDATLDEHHWLGHHLVGETMRYVALGPTGAWWALVGFGSPALACRPRDRFIGWSDDQHFRRLRFVTNNQRYCVLPQGRRTNLATNVLAKTLRRLSSDFESRWGHPVLLVETFVDPERHHGTCYLAGGFAALGETSGYGRSAGRYYHHGKTKLVFARQLRRDATHILTRDFDHPALVGERKTVIDLEALDFGGEEGLLCALEQIVDHRRRRGVRHSLAAILAIAICATLAGARSVAAIGEYAADCPQEVLRRLGAKFHPLRRHYVAPSADTFGRALSNVTAAALDQVFGAWLFRQVTAGRLDDETLAIALDGKTMRGALREDGRQVHLFSAMVHGAGIVIGQREVDEKSNEITAFRPLLEALTLTGALVTADALHCQRDHAVFVVDDKHADYLLQVKANQPSLLSRIEAIGEDEWSEVFSESDRGHGRTEHRFVSVAKAPEGLDFPYAATVVRVVRERGDLGDRMTSEETSYYVSSVAYDPERTARLGRHVREHWGIENKVHWVRDWNFDEDRHQLRAPSSTARAMAALRNLAISLLRLAGATNLAAALRWVARDATRAAALIGA